MTRTIDLEDLVDNLLLDHIGLPQVFIVIAGWVKGIILRHSY